MGDHADDAIDRALDEDLFRLEALADGDFGNDPDSFLFFNPGRNKRPSDHLWYPKTGPAVLIPDMTYAHLRNTVAMLERSGKPWVLRSEKFFELKAALEAKKPAAQGG